LNSSVHHPQSSTVTLLSQVQVTPHCVTLVLKLMADLCIGIRCVPRITCEVKQQSEGWSFGSLQTTGTANGIAWCFPLGQALRSTAHVETQI
jgi:hypothetical protein